MDFLKPNLIWVEDRCYRYYDDDAKEDILTTGYDQEILIHDDNDNVGTLCSDGSYNISFHLPEKMMGYIMGKNAATKKHIEFDTKATINICPKDEDNIKISGKTNKSVSMAKNRIKNIVNRNRKSFPSTHFISIPIMSENLKTRFTNFKKEILEKYEDPGIEESIFPEVQKLHLTVTMLTLLDEVEVRGCTRLLQDHYQTALKGLIGEEPVVVNIKGIEYMNDDPSQVDVLYAKVDPYQDLDRLQTLVDSLVDRLVADGMVQRQYERVKLHVTIMNSKYRNKQHDDHLQSNPTNRWNNQPPERRLTFDARNILKHYAQYDFGRAQISSIQLSRRFTTGKDGYYIPDFTIHL